MNALGVLTPHCAILICFVYQLLGDLPDVAGGVFETGGTNTPGAIQRAVEQLYAACG